MFTDKVLKIFTRLNKPLLVTIDASFLIPYRYSHYTVQ